MGLGRVRIQFEPILEGDLIEHDVDNKEVIDVKLLARCINGEKEALGEIRCSLMNNGWWIKAANLNLESVGYYYGDDYNTKSRRDDGILHDFILGKSHLEKPLQVKENLHHKKMDKKKEKYDPTIELEFIKNHSKLVDAWIVQEALKGEDFLKNIALHQIYSRSLESFKQTKPSSNGNCKPSVKSFKEALLSVPKSDNLSFSLAHSVKDYTKSNGKLNKKQKGRLGRKEERKMYQLLDETQEVNNIVSVRSETVAQDKSTKSPDASIKTREANIEPLATSTNDKLAENLKFSVVVEILNPSFISHDYTLSSANDEGAFEEVLEEFSSEKSKNHIISTSSNEVANGEVVADGNMEMKGSGYHYFKESLVVSQNEPSACQDDPNAYQDEPSACQDGLLDNSTDIYNPIVVASFPCFDMVVVNNSIEVDHLDVVDDPIADVPPGFENPHVWLAREYSSISDKGETKSNSSVMSTDKESSLSLNNSHDNSLGSVVHNLNQLKVFKKRGRPRKFSNKLVKAFQLPSIGKRKGVSGIQAKKKVNYKKEVALVLESSLLMGLEIEGNKEQALVLIEERVKA
ncbi:hypothetical protein AgCh_021791 [Apium graveolens]